MSVADALMYVRKVRPHAVETPEQEEVLTELARRIQARSVEAQQEDSLRTL